MSLTRLAWWQSDIDGRGRLLAGVSFVIMGLVIVLGIITAEAFFPGYSTKSQTLSALGAARGTPGSRAIFNPALFLAGGLLLFSAYGLQQEFGRRSLTIVVTLAGIGMAGAAIFPSETGLPHGLAAILAFTGLGLAPLVTAGVIKGTFGRISGFFGALGLVIMLLWTVLHPPTGSVQGLGVLLTFLSVGVGAIAVAAVSEGAYRIVPAAIGIGSVATLVVLFGLVPSGSTFRDVTSLGVGGLERWVTYIAVLWFTAFGGYLLSEESVGRTDRIE